ncbi:MAG: hypothetical protein JSR30_00295 [Proteobacteria bacterium]|nr:hypothetical protein [Pseudomonadota bacterium]
MTALENATPLERTIIQSLRTESGFWNGDRNALMALRRFELETQHAAKIEDFKKFLNDRLELERKAVIAGLEEILATFRK